MMFRTLSRIPRRIPASIACLACFLAVHHIDAQVIPSGWNDASVVGGFYEPVGATWDANGRMYVWEKRGTVQIVVGGTVTGTLIDISAEVGGWRDHGLLGFALDPAFLSNGYIYLLYVVDRHHLMNYGTGSYNAAIDEYFSATVMRITRYTATGPLFNTVNYGSRLVLFGESPSTGAPVLHESHSAGSLVFGSDGSLLAGLGDGASYNSTDVGSASESYYGQALADGIIRPAENVGAMRCQMVNSFSGRVIRIDPATGDGLPSNPFWNAGAPRSAASRTWCLGLRNPYRMCLRPGTGSIDPADGDPGTLYIGDVGWNGWEDLNVCYEAGMDFGWPQFEGMEENTSYSGATVYNLDEPNPLYDGINCTEPYFQFKDLLKQDTPVHLNGHPNPCDPSQQIPNSNHKFFHARPAIDWKHGNQSRCGGFSGNTAVTWDLIDPASPVPGPNFGGNTSLGGMWVAGANLPAGYQNVYFHADYASGWIRKFTFDAADAPMEVFDFASSLAPLTWIGSGPDGCIAYIDYLGSEVRRICPIGTVNLPPVAVAQQNVQYGPGPLTVNFTGVNSTDPESQPLTYLWDFGDGSPTSPAANPSHQFTAPPGVPTSYTVTLTVTDNASQTDQATLLVSVNNTPPVVNITSFDDGDFYPVGVDTLFDLAASVTDTEHPPAQLTYAWQTILHHNTHVHPEAVDNTPVTSTVISGAGCDGEDYHYEIKLTVTDAGGLSTTDVNTIHPRCYAIAPTAIITASVNAGEGPLLVVFDGTSSYDPGTIVSYQWDFGDGTSATGPSPSHVFSVTGDHTVVLTVTDDDGLTGQGSKVISVITFDPPQCVGATGSILRQYWNGISGTTVSSLTSSPSYPDSPSGSTYPVSFQGPTNAGSNYGTRMRGYIIAPEDGNYTFVATSDNSSVFYISLNADPKHKQLACSVPGFTGATEFTKYAAQTSAPITLKAGKYYYVEMLHKEGSGSDHCAMYWQRPSNPTTTLIAGTYLARWQDCPPSVTMRAALQGPYDPSNGLMNDDLRAGGMIPSGEPFTALGFTHAGGGGGETVPGGLLAVTGPNAIVDWVLVELRDKNNPSTILRTRSALLQRDGDVVGTDGYPRLLFNGLASDNYYVAVRHRNHLGAMTFGSKTLDKSETGVDFTLGTTATYGTDARVVLGNGRRALWAGNAWRDGVIKYTGSFNDRDPILQTIGGSVPTITVPGYLMTDVNLDGITKYTGVKNDRDLILLNIGGSVPTGTRLQQLP